MGLAALQHEKCIRDFVQNKTTHVIRALLEAVDEWSASELFLLNLQQTISQNRNKRTSSTDSYRLKVRNPFLDQIGQHRNQMLIMLEVQLLDAHDKQMPNFVDRLYVLGLLRSSGQ